MEAVTKRYLLTVAYDGTSFHGWQKQEPPDSEPLRTVQHTLEQTLARVLRQPVSTMGASRTDAGVHAGSLPPPEEPPEEPPEDAVDDLTVCCGQAVSFTAASRIPTERMAEAIRSRLPEQLDVRRVIEVPDHFDVISDVTDKQYRYRVFNHTARPLLRRKSVYHCWFPLDPLAMDAAARKLAGTHDFACLANSNHGRDDTVRTIHDCRVEHHPRDHEIHVVVSGSGFLYHMVRIIAGTLIEVGRGRFDADHIDRILQENDRQLAGPTLPPHGLCLEWIRYRDDALLDHAT